MHRCHLCTCLNLFHAARKTGCQCFVSLNVVDHTLYPSIEKYIIEQVEEDPKLFYFE